MGEKESIMVVDPNGEWAKLSIGDTVKAKAFGFWYDAKIVSFGYKLIKVEYTSGTGVTRQKSVLFADLIMQPEEEELMVEIWTL